MTNKQKPPAPQGTGGYGFQMKGLTMLQVFRRLFCDHDFQPTDQIRMRDGAFYDDLEDRKEVCAKCGKARWVKA